jgi:hypothetical protein
VKDPERRVPEAERVKDLEVQEDEARDIAGGRKKDRAMRGKKAAGRVHGEPINERRQS